MFCIRRGIYDVCMMLGYFVRRFEYLHIIFDRHGYLDNLVCSIGVLFLLFQPPYIRVVCYHDCVAYNVGRYKCLSDMFDDRHRIIQRGAEIDAIRKNFRHSQRIYDEERWKMQRFLKNMSRIE